MTFNSALETLLKKFGGTHYKEISLDVMKFEVSNILKEVTSNSPAEKAIITKFRTKISKAKEKEKLLMVISEQMFALSGESV